MRPVATSAPSSIRPGFPAVLVLTLLVVLWGATGCHRSAPERPNVILISLDTVRPDHLGCYGYERSTSPLIDSLASEGVLFQNASAQSPWTLPSHATLFSGTFAMTHGVVDDNSRIPPALPLMAEVFRTFGYRTSGVVSSFYVGRTFGFERGFDEFEDFGADIQGQVVPGEKVQAEAVVDRGMAWLGGAREPFFLFLHFYDAHVNYTVPEPWRSRFEPSQAGPEIPYKTYAHYLTSPLSSAQQSHVLAQYDGAIAYIDHELGRVIDAVDRRGARGRTIIVVLSDHGDEFFERGSWGHGETLHREVLDVPLILCDPRASRRGVHVEAPVRLLDVLPTVLDLAGLPLPEGVQGQSLRPLLESDGGAWDPLLFASTSRFTTNLMSLVSPPMEVMADMNSLEAEVYNLADDPGESEDLAPSDPELSSALLDEAITVAAELIPGRLVVSCEPPSRTDVCSGTLRSQGAFGAVECRMSGPGAAELSEDRHCLTFSWEGSGELRVATIPVDAGVEVDLGFDGPATPEDIYVGGEARCPGRLPLLFPGVIRSADLLRPPPRKGPGAYIWKDPGEWDAPRPVDLSDEAKDRLRSLGYVH